MTNLLTAILVLRLLAASQVLLALLAMAFSSNPIRTRLLGVALALGGVSYLLSSPVFNHINLNVGPGLALPADAIPPLLFFFAWDLFEDDRQPPLLVWLMAAVYVVIASWFGITKGTFDVAVSMYLTVPLQLTKLGFALGAIYIVWRGRENDVVETRLNLRRVFAASIAVIVVVVVVTELIAKWRVPELVELLAMVAIFAVTLTINFVFLRLNPKFVLTDMRRLPPMLPEEEELVTQLKKIMLVDRVYIDHDLRIAELASSLKVPEHQLRRTINQTSVIKTLISL